MARRRHKKRTQRVAPPDASTQSSTGLSQSLNASASRIPKTMVIRIGASEVGPSVSNLVRDVRQMMEPHTASRLRERKSNKLRDYTTMAGPLGVTSLLLFSRNPNTGSTTLRMATCPHGPTIHFRINEYSLCKDIRQGLRNTKSPGKEFTTPPMVVMNKFNTTAPNADGTPGRPHVHEQLLHSTCSQLFPAISPLTTPIDSVRRVVLFNRKPVAPGSSEVVIDVRHYAITTKSVGLSRAIRRINAAEKLVKKHADAGKSKGGVPNLGKLEDIADYMLDPAAAAGGYISESEIDEDAEVEVLNPAARQVKRKRTGPREAQKKVVKLMELGPRMTLEMVKIEEGMSDGKTLWHSWEKKSQAEEKELEVRHEKKRQERERRRKEQMVNLEKKAARKGGDDDEDEDIDEGLFDDDEDPESEEGDEEMEDD